MTTAQITPPIVDVLRTNFLEAWEKEKLGWQYQKTEEGAKEDAWLK